MDKTDKKQEILEELEALSPGLHKLLHRQQPDDLPFRYFEQLPDQVIDKITQTQKDHSNWLQSVIFLLTTRKKWLLAFATSVIILFMSGLYFLKSDDESKLNLDFASIPVDEVQSYLLRHANELDEAQLGLLSPGIDKMDLINVSDDDLQPIIEDYLYQITDHDLN